MRTVMPARWHCAIASQTSSRSGSDSPTTATNVRSRSRFSASRPSRLSPPLPPGCGSIRSLYASANVLRMHTCQMESMSYPILYAALDSTFKLAAGDRLCCMMPAPPKSVCSEVSWACTCCHRQQSSAGCGPSPLGTGAQCCGHPQSASCTAGTAIPRLLWCTDVPHKTPLGLHAGEDVLSGTTRNWHDT